MTTFNGSAGNDVANAATGELTGFTGGTVAELQDLVGDSIFAFEGDDFVFAGNGNDQIEGWDGHDMINGGAGDDLVWANQISDVGGSLIGDGLVGNDGSDQLYGSGGGDSMDGGHGTDRLYGDGADDLVQGGVGQDFLHGGDGNDTLYAYGIGLADDPFENYLYGEAGNDGMTGGEGRDYFDGGPGADTMLGGAGNDIFEFRAGDVAAGEIIDGGAGTTNVFDVLESVDLTAAGSIGGIAQVRFLDAPTLDTATAVFTAAQVKTGMAADLAVGHFGDIAATFQVEMRAETVLDLSAVTLGFYTWDADDQVVVVGDAHAEFVTGTSRIDRLFGAGGNDTLDGGAGDDQLAGGAGNENYYVDDAGDTVVELAGQGTDRVLTTLIAYTLGAHVERLAFIGAGNFVGRGNALANLIVGGSGNDRFVVDGGGADRYAGGLGTDTADYRVSAIGATVNLTSGATGGAAAGDTFSSIEWLFGSNTGADRLVGNTGANRLDGLGGNDTLNGADNADVLNGGAALDEIRGGAGRDTMSGGAGADDFNYSSTTESGTAAATRDRITDFVHLSDDIDVSAVDARAGASGNNAFVFRAQEAFTAEGQIRAYQSGGNTIVEFNTTGASGAEMTIQLDAFTATTLTAADFVL